jgi:hypothetical protein
LQTYEGVFQRFHPRLSTALPVLRVDEVCQLFFAYAAFNSAQNADFYAALPERIQAVSVPKQLFCKYLAALVQQLHFKHAV